MDKEYISKIVDIAIAEDLANGGGDITTDSIIANEIVCFSINSREEMVVCGIPILEDILSRFSFHEHTIHKRDGDLIASDVTIASGIVRAAEMLSLERIMLNFLQHASGIASITRNFVQQIEGTGTRIRDTRKTTPGLRQLDKYAVSIGGGYSYRMGLFDAILIKDNHLASCNGNVEEVISRVREGRGDDVFIAIECDTLNQVEQALKNQANMIMLDNMGIKQIKKAVSIIRNQEMQSEVIIEASGNVNLKNVRAIAETGVDFISVGSITHSAPNKDIGLDVSYTE